MKSFFLLMKIPVPTIGESPPRSAENDIIHLLIIY